MASKQKYKILMVDDDLNLGSLVQRWLPAEAFSWTAIVNGEEALDKVGQVKPDLILLDVMMPGMNGYEFCEKLRGLKEFIDTPVIFMTGLNDEQNKAKALMLGAAAYLSKPVRKEDLLLSINKALVLRAQAAAESENRPALKNDYEKLVTGFSQFKNYLKAQPFLKPEFFEELQKIKSAAYCDAEDHLGLSPEQRTQLISNFSGVEYLPYIDAEEIELGILAASFCIKNTTVPIRKKNGKLCLAMANPFDLEMFDLLKKTKLGNENFDLALSSARTIRYLFGVEGVRQDFGPEIDISSGPLPGGNSSDGFAKHTVAATFNILASAVTQRASDIHIEPKKNHFDVRFRIDGEMKDVYAIEKELGLQLITRFKALAGMDISERRKPQDGASEFKIQEKTMKFRFATTATPFGESIIIRLLDPNMRPKKLEELGMTEDQAKQMVRFATRDRGFVLVVGPTGSGKTTTIYSLISLIDCKSKSVMTIEDPVEYWIPYANQQQVNEKAGLTFESVLKSCVRQDPDILFLGEIRDAFSAKTSFDFTSTGHLTIATMHTSNATTAFFRLGRLGVARSAMSDTVLGVIAQRLLKTVCDDCAVIETPTPQEIKIMEQFTSDIPAKVAHAKGCIRCNQTGYHGRVAIYEIIEVDPKIAGMIRDEKSIAEIRQVVKERGGYLLPSHALEKIRTLKTSPAEAIQKVLAEEMIEAEMDFQEEDAPKVKKADFQTPRSNKPGANHARTDSAFSPAGGRLLLVEDDEAMAQLMTRALENRGYEVVAAGDAFEALMLVGKMQFDLILSDINMPNLDGLKFMEILQQKGIKVPVIFLTGDTTAETEQKCLTAGAADYIKKPVDKNILILRVQKYLDSKRQA